LRKRLYQKKLDNLHARNYTSGMLSNDNGEAALEFYDKRRKWAEFAVTHEGLSDRGFRVGYWLSKRMNGDDQCCWYTIPRMAREIGKSERYVQYAIADLIEAKLLLVVRERGKPNTYYLRAPFF
jgi:hypothetical protein